MIGGSGFVPEPLSFIDQYSDPPPSNPEMTNFSQLRLPIDTPRSRRTGQESESRLRGATAETPIFRTQKARTSGGRGRNRRDVRFLILWRVPLGLKRTGRYGIVGPW
ncbi:hypothetical protein BJY16_001927 [Actinoplanes octamycinicus]|uniref:Uncharacterized protein n=1 Tax=Actinoplanes octamycinicus TaxID=135948 RepID=A0A7W7M672_9ACTN|nr:hypothetical protein [Actinoplanes octamycinicus]MBB4738468.1 hypothetical protein [Actinoplanes octamycinicus]GIE57587.1 hypothetical protein Aoc01nite_29890 [Actinoplanes octamycinicus]